MALLGGGEFVVLAQQGAGVGAQKPVLGVPVAFGVRRVGLDQPLGGEIRQHFKIVFVFDRFDAADDTSHG